MIRRRFVNLVAEDRTSGARLLHRLDAAKHLFYPSTADAEAAHAEDGGNNGGRRRKLPSMGILRRLPKPRMRFERFPAKNHHRELDDTFVLLGTGGGSSSEGRILHAGDEGHANLYDAVSGAATAMPNLQRRDGRRRPMFISIAGGTGAGKEDHESLYVMSFHKGDPSFQVLDFNQRPHKWEPLPLPPFAGDRSASFIVRSFTVVGGGRTICVSTSSKGTFSFDTRSHEWWQAGDWALPFRGRSEHVPELGTWLGFRPPRSHYYLDPFHLCASSDLSAMDALRHRAPQLQHVWEDLNPPKEEEMLELKRGAFRGTVLNRWKEWSPSLNLGPINLGGGRFCIAKVFRVVESITLSFDGDTAEDYCVVLSGVEVIRGGDGGGLQMVKHRSKCYNMSGGDKIHWVL